jgi:hypothetical protein
MKTLKNFRSWEKQHLHEYRTPSGPVRVITEHNQAYGDIITRFEIGGTTVCPVLSRYTGNPMEFSESNNRIGEREFERGSMTWEFLFKPLGFEPTGRVVTAFYPFDQFMRSKGWA